MRNLFAAIDDRRKIELNRLIFALGIRHIGEGNAKLLARHYGSFAAFREAMLAAAAGQGAEENTSEAYSDLNAIDGVGEIVADAVVEFFAEKRNVKALDELLERDRGARCRTGQDRYAGGRQDGGVHGLADQVHA